MSEAPPGLDTPLTEDPDMNWTLSVRCSVPLELESAVRAGPQPGVPCWWWPQASGNTGVLGPEEEDGTGCSA